MEGEPLTIVKEVDVEGEGAAVGLVTGAIEEACKTKATKRERRKANVSRTI